jgi:amino acid permease
MRWTISTEIRQEPTTVNRISNGKILYEKRAFVETDLRNPSSDAHLEKKEKMNKIKAILCFYVISFIGIYAIYLFVEPKSYFSTEISRSINGQNGLTGFIALAFFVTVFGAVIFLSSHICGGGILNIAKEFEHGGFWKGIRTLFLGKPKNR